MTATATIADLTARTIARIERMMRLGTEQQVDGYIAALAVAERDVMELIGGAAPVELAGDRVGAQAYAAAARHASLFLRVSGLAYTGPGYMQREIECDDSRGCRCRDCR